MKRSMLKIIITFVTALIPSAFTWAHYPGTLGEITALDLIVGESKDAIKTLKDYVNQNTELTAFDLCQNENFKKHIEFLSASSDVAESDSKAIKHEIAVLLKICQEMSENSTHSEIGLIYNELQRIINYGEVIRIQRNQRSKLLM